MDSADRRKRTRSRKRRYQGNQHDKSTEETAEDNQQTTTQVDIVESTPKPTQSESSTMTTNAETPIPVKAASAKKLKLDESMCKESVGNQYEVPVECYVLCTV